MNKSSQVLGFETHDPASAPVKVAHDVPLIFIRGNAFDLHDRFQKDRVASFEGVLHGKNCSQLKRQLVRVDVVIRTVNDLDMEIDHRVPTEHTV